MKINNLNLGTTTDGNFKFDFKSSTFNASTVPIAEKREILQNTPVKIINSSIKQNLILESQKNGETVYQTILPAQKIDVNLLENKTTRTTTNPSLGFVSAQTVKDIKEPGFNDNKESTFGIAIKGAAIQATGNTITVSDNTTTKYGLVLSSGEQNNTIQINADQAVRVNNTRNFVVLPDQVPGQGAILATNIAGQLIPQLDVSLINNDQGNPALLNPDLIPFSNNVYRGGNSALEIANSTVSFSRQLEVGKAFPPVSTYGFSVSLADTYTSKISQKSAYANLSSERSIFSRSFDPINANLNISTRIQDINGNFSDFNNKNNVSIYPEVNVNQTTQTGEKNTFTTIFKTYNRIPEFAVFTQQRSRQQFSQLVTGFTVNTTTNKFEINPFLKAVFAQYGQNGLYINLAGQIYMITNDTQRSKISANMGTNIKFGENTSIQPYLSTVYNFGDFIVRASTYSLNTGSGVSAGIDYTHKNNSFGVNFATSSQPGVTNSSNQFSVLWKNSW